eukprot:scaffold214436_cov21-Tisochrysis_lutea.AAC.1
MDVTHHCSAAQRVVQILKAICPKTFTPTLVKEPVCDCCTRSVLTQQQQIDLQCHFSFSTYRLALIQLHCQQQLIRLQCRADFNKTCE